jgi:hypothetical protein
MKLLGSVLIWFSRAVFNGQEFSEWVRETLRQANDRHL